MYSAFWATCTTFGSQLRRRHWARPPGVSPPSAEDELELLKGCGLVVRAAVLREERHACQPGSFSAEDSSDLGKGGVEKPDFIISGIPLGNLGREKALALIDTIYQTLGEGGMYI